MRGVFLGLKDATLRLQQWENWLAKWTRRCLTRFRIQIERL
jgi:hypothetical protein